MRDASLARECMFIGEWSLGAEFIWHSCWRGPEPATQHRRLLLTSVRSRWFAAIDVGRASLPPTCNRPTVWLPRVTAEDALAAGPPETQREKSRSVREAALP